MLLATLVSSVEGFTQQAPLDSLLKKFDNYRKQALQEKLFVHTDRSFYLTGETIWFSVYSVDGSFHKPLGLNRVAYLEIIDPENKAVLQTKIAMRDGGGNGTFFLPTSLYSGHYLLRAYTQWMRNFSPDFYFQLPVTVVNPFSKLGLKPPDEKPQYDVQFFPEGGHLVNGLQSTVGFRAVNAYGTGIAFSGSVIDEHNDTVAHFQPLKFGIGRFSFTPLSSHRYKAIVHDLHGNITVVPLPLTVPEGYAIQVNDSASHQIAIRVSSQFTDPASRKPFVYFLAHTRQTGAVARMQYLVQGKTTFLIPKNLLGDGISHFTIFNDEMMPVCERLYFKRPAGQLTVEVKTDKVLYDPRKKINLDLIVHNREGLPEEMDLSVSVHRLDSLRSNAADIVSYLWLTSELRGGIESPGYYFGEGVNDVVSMDNLMLTHGWSRFRWEDIANYKSKSFEFIPEQNGHIIRGRVLDKNTGVPAGRINAYLSTPAKNIRLYISRSNSEGEVQFEVKDIIGSRRIIAQTNYVVDSTYRVELISSFSENIPVDRFGKFDLSENLKNAIAARSFQMQIQNAYYDENPNHIAIPVIDSVAFYGKPDETYWLDDYTRFPTLEEVMREYVPGVLVRVHKGKFHFMTLDRPNKSVFRNDPLVLLDGMPVFDVDRIMEFDPRKIKKLDVVTKRYFLGPLSFEGLVSYTTYRGDLGDFQPDPQALVAKYDGLQWSREFFSPRYDFPLQHESRIPDLRNLLYWSPNVKTSKQGKKQLDFYSSDAAGVYTVVVQGITRNGLPGTGSFNFTIADHEHN